MNCRVPVSFALLRGDHDTSSDSFFQAREVDLDLSICSSLKSVIGTLGYAYAPYQYQETSFSAAYFADGQLIRSSVS